MKTKKNILVASGTMLAAGMAQGAVIYNQVNQVQSTSDSGYNFDLNSDGQDDFKVFFDANNSTKPCVLGTPSVSGPTPYVLNELIMTPANTDNNGIPVIPFATNISSQITVGTNTVAVGYTDQHSKNEGYFYQNGENQVVGQWPPGQDTFGYVALALVDTNATPATTNYGWVQVELNYASANPFLQIIDYAYQDISGSNILAGQERDITPIPDIYHSPTNQIVAAGVTVNMSVVAMSDPMPSSYQWMAGAPGSGVYTNLPNAGIYSGTDTPNLTISNVAPANHLDYVVAVANANGSVTSSPPATLTVIAVGVVGPVPNQQMIYAGHPTQFAVTDIGGVATTNLWLLNGAGLNNGAAFSGVTTTNLMVSSVDPTNLGNYQAVASTGFGSITSTVAPLSIVYPDGSLYESNVIAYGAVDYYRLNETSGTNAWDFLGGKNGTYGSDAVLGQAGPALATGFPGFVSTNYSATFQALDPNNLLPLLPWNLNTNTVTITAWIYPQFNQGNAGIVFTAGANNMICGIRYDGGYANTNGISDGNIGYNWNNNYADWGWNSGITAPHNQWSFVALAVSPTDAKLYIINSGGMQTATNIVAHPVQAFDATEYIGTYPLDGALGNNNFNGNIDEVAIFKSTLTPYQIQALYDSGINVVLPPPPNPTIAISTVGGGIQIQWTGGTLLQASSLLGPWTPVTPAASPYAVSPTNSQGYFRAEQ